MCYFCFADRAHGSCGLDWWWFGVVVAAGIGLGMGTTEERQKGNKVGMSESAVAVGAATLIGALLSLTSRTLGVKNNKLGMFYKQLLSSELQGKKHEKMKKNVRVLKIVTSHGHQELLAAS
ncbi:uncharacterized protein LOC133801419 [Humulus lupulus]|uniref:uncharacterized protein LOC133801419 n=1 Tax=Humulus lupulus TaxID=3486 RepID=UPI002B40BFF1|nr:uncharacterized protein LOC133801419 [Humulus lupulus]